MSIPQYEAFLKTVELGSVTRAAEALGYTQSGVSHMLNALEESCGLRLLVRERSNVHLTSDGEQLLPYFQAICHSQRSLTAKTNEIHRLESGLIRVGTFTSVSAQWLPGMISRFRKNYPKVQFELLHGTIEENETWVMQGRVDCAFVRLPVTKPLYAVFLKRDPLVAVLPEGHEYADAAYIPIESLPQFPYIKMDEGVDDEVSEMLDSYHVKPDVHFALRDDYAIIAMVERGLGVTVLPELVLKDTPRKVVVRALDVSAYREIGIAVRDKRLMSISTERFVACVQDWVSAEYGCD